jgi:hypothetical protein
VRLEEEYFKHLPTAAKYKDSDSSAAATAARLEVKILDDLLRYVRLIQGRGG